MLSRTILCALSMASCIINIHAKTFYSMEEYYDHVSDGSNLTSTDRQEILHNAKTNHHNARFEFVKAAIIEQVRKNEGNGIASQTQQELDSRTIEQTPQGILASVLPKNKPAFFRPNPINGQLQSQAYCSDCGLWRKDDDRIYVPLRSDMHPEGDGYSFDTCGHDICIKCAEQMLKEGKSNTAALQCPNNKCKKPVSSYVLGLLIKYYLPRSSFAHGQNYR